MRFSVVVPVYNALPYLGDCVASALGSSREDTEIILVDDGSTDGSSAECDRLAGTAENVRVIHRDNGGQTAARETGIKAARGDCIIFLDADDTLLPGALDRIAEATDRYGCDLLIYRLIKNGEPCRDFFGGERGEISIDEFLETLIRQTGLNSLCIKAFARKLFDGVDLSEIAGFRNGEDLLLSLKAAMNAEKIAYIPDTLYLYRVTPGSITNTVNERQPEEYELSREIVWRALESRGLATDENRFALLEGFMRRMADFALCVSRSELPFDKKAGLFNDIRERGYFREAKQKNCVKNLGAAKKLRLRLIDKGYYRAVVAFDRLRR